jgi:MoaA/NifB/PqqE/SkfB family radical SAM enzyme
MLRIVSERENNPSLFEQTVTPARFAAGYHEEEWDDVDSFRWMDLEGSLEFEPREERRFLEFWVASEFHDLSQVLTTQLGGEATAHTLVRGWMRLSVPVGPGARAVVLIADKLFPAELHAQDQRRLAVRVRRPVLHADADRHRHIERQARNAVANLREMLAGQAVLESTPPHLGIDLYGVCNVKPPCVYCEWDWSKELEGAYVDAPFTRETLREYGDFFHQSRELVNCSIGEPFMMKNLDELLDEFGSQGKVLEMTTNGQILTDRNIDRLLGRDIDLYISLDAGNAQTYAKLRNDRWDPILVNLKRLITAKGGRGELPRVHLVFMPMRVNVHELEQFVRLCADLGVDRMVLRPLNYADSIDLQWDRGGYRFSYQEELLPFAELVRISGQAAELCARHDVRLSDQMDFGGALAASFQEEFERGKDSVDAELQRVVEKGPSREPKVSSSEGPAETAEAAEPAAATPVRSLGEEALPICREPWESLYILRRGVFPCCYGGVPLGEMNDYREAWNSPLLQAIRADLTRGRFHRYCLDSPSCPIVRKSEHAHRLPLRQAAFLRARRAWHRLDDLCFGVPRSIYRQFKNLGRWLTGRPRVPAPPSRD